MASSEPAANIKCAACENEIADSQRVEHQGKIYCTGCVGRAIDLAQQQTHATHSVAGATLLAFIPGLGAMYNRQMKKGAFIMLLIIGLPIFFAELGGASYLFAIMPAIYFWSIFDAYYVAIAIRDSQAPAPDLDLKGLNKIDLSIIDLEALKPDVKLPPVNLRREKADQPSSAAVGFGVLLVILGVLFLLNNFGVHWLTHDRLWPTAMLALGLWLLFSFAASRWSVSVSEKSTPAAPADANPTAGVEDTPQESFDDGDDNGTITD